MKKNKSLNVLFINMVNPSREIENLYPPLGPAYLASYCQKKLGKGKVKFKMISDNFKSEIKRIKPDILGISCVSQNYSMAIELAKFAKKKVSTIMIGGSHISLFPESLDPSFNIGVVGEGEETFTEIISQILEKKWNKKNMSKTSGIIFWDKKKLIKTPFRPLIKDLDTIPYPDRSLFEVNRNKAYIFSSRGCPYRCVFCASSRLWKQTRFHSANYVFHEIKGLVDNFGITRIDFYDDLFIANKKRVRELAELIEKSSINKKVQFQVNARANLVDDEICISLKKMNVKGIGMGLESGSDKMLSYLKGENVNVSQNIKAVNTAKKYGFYTVASFIIGSPDDTKETIMQTLKFIKESKLDEFEVYSLTPLPGTPVWDYAIDRGLIPSDIKNFDWKAIDVEYQRSHDYNIHLAKNITREEFYKLYNLFVREKRIRTIKRAVYLMFTDPKRFIYHVGNRTSRFINNLKVIGSEK